MGGPAPAGDGRLFVALEGEAVVGCALAGLAADRTAWITDVAVLDRVRRRGVGRRLVAATIGWAGKRGASVVRVEAAERAEGFWRAVGFGGSGRILERIP